MSIHKEHRQRVKARYESYGLDLFDEHQALELLLFYCVPRRDTNVIAHNLINRFHTFGQVLDASVSELEKVEGVGHSVALYIKLLRDTQRYYLTHREKDDVILDDLDACGQYLTNYFDGYKNEAVFMLGMDAKRKVLCCREVAKGSVNSTAISIRKIVDVALSENVTSVILAHNHPSGLALPSADDIRTTQCVAQALRAIDVQLLDHVIVCETEFVSLTLSGLFKADRL